MLSLLINTNLLDAARDEDIDRHLYSSSVRV
jgi:nucleoside-diphosphate-sugar epimerase